VDHQCLDRVRAAAGDESAGRRQRRRDPLAVEPQDEHQRPNHRARTTTRRSRTDPDSHVSRGRQDRHRWLPGVAALGALVALEPISRRSAASRSSPSTALLAPADAGNARTTTSAPAGKFANLHRMRCRSRRCTRCRTTEPPTARLTTKPIFGPVSGRDSAASTRAQCTTTEPQAARRPRCTAVAKSSRRVSRMAAESNAKYPPNANASGRQLSATLAAPGREDGPTSAGAHAQPEPVGSRATTVVRLERTLALGHGCRSPGAGCSVLDCGVAAVGTATVRTRAIRTEGGQVIPCRHRRHCCERVSPGTRTTLGHGRGHARMPAGRRETPRA
jgi:hypothetical protein